MSICRRGIFKVDVTVDSAKFAGGRQTVSLRFLTFGVTPRSTAMPTSVNESVPLGFGSVRCTGEGDASYAARARVTAKVLGPCHSSSSL
jgi:hypothetical protein